VSSTDPPLRLLLPARAENVIVVRQAVGLSDERLADLKTVVTEACNNVVLHAYEGEPGPLEVCASWDGSAIEVVVNDRGSGFRPDLSEARRTTLGLGLPLLASLSDSFEISGGAGVGTSMRIRIAFEAPVPASSNGAAASPARETALAMVAGAAVQPVLARVIGALAARADFSLDRLSDTVLLGDAVSTHRPGDFTDGRVGISIEDSSGALRVRVGPLIEGGGDRILAAMDIPGEGGSLRTLAKSMEVTTTETAAGPAEYLEIDV
jgi:serine/threonine-protein kinase RsbW